MNISHPYGYIYMTEMGEMRLAKTGIGMQYVIIVNAIQFMDEDLDICLLNINKNSNEVNKDNTGETWRVSG